jgi:hypothetical protein
MFFSHIIWNFCIYFGNKFRILYHVQKMIRKCSNFLNWTRKKNSKLFQYSKLGSENHPSYSEENYKVFTKCYVIRNILLNSKKIPTTDTKHNMAAKFFWSYKNDLNNSFTCTTSISWIQYSFCVQHVIPK